MSRDIPARMTTKSSPKAARNISTSQRVQGHDLLERDQLVACCGNLGVHILSMSFTVQLRCAKFLLII